MKKIFAGLLALIFTLPQAVMADIGDLPDDTVWYVHVDLEAMRGGDAGGRLYEWFEGEGVVDIKDEVGIDIGKEVNSLTMFSNADDGSVIIVDGPVTKESKDKMLALAAQEGPVDPREYKGETYYFFGDEERADYDADEPLDDLKESVYLSFAVKDKILVAAREEQLKELIDNKGRVSGSRSHDGALLVLSANKPLVQAGMQPEGMIDDDGDDDWDSKIVRNTREAALLMADENGLLALQAKLVSTDPKMAEALGGIVNGLIALQAFNDELGPEIQDLVRNTKVEVLENVLSINMVIDPDKFIAVLDD